MTDISTGRRPESTVTNTQTSALDDKIARKRTYFWITLGVSLLRVFTFEPRTIVLPPFCPNFPPGIYERPKRHRVHIIHETYSKPKSDMPVKECPPSSRVCSDNVSRSCLVANDYFPKEAQSSNANASFPSLSLASFHSNMTSFRHICYNVVCSKSK